MWCSMVRMWEIMKFKHEFSMGGGGKGEGGRGRGGGEGGGEGGEVQIVAADT